MNKSQKKNIEKTINSLLEERKNVDAKYRDLFDVGIIYTAKVSEYTLKDTISTYLMKAYIQKTHTKVQKSKDLEDATRFVAKSIMDNIYSDALREFNALEPVLSVDIHIPEGEYTIIEGKAIPKSSSSIQYKTKKPKDLKKTKGQFMNQYINKPKTKSRIGEYIEESITNISNDLNVSTDQYKKAFVNGANTALQVMDKLRDILYKNNN